ncbi:MAG: type II toxin-antitoxin system prevent-host-death family antitoxin [Betaproteobacteria bacterium]|nr:type II toxin-antitoxin system prevent-host-death family antitoxin [Betaproteobacteria bacterium]
MAITATRLRSDLYRVIDEVIRKGVPVEVELRGRKVRIVPAEPRDKLANLVKRPGVIVGDSGRVARVTAFDEKKWRRKWDRRLK